MSPAPEPTAGNTLVSDGALASIRETLRGTLTSFAIVERPANTATGQGGANTSGTSFVTVDEGGGVPCAMAPLVSRALAGVEAQQDVALDRWRVRFDYCAPPIGPGYRLTISGIDVAGGPWTRRVIVLGEHTPRTLSAARIYICENAGPGRR